MEEDTPLAFSKHQRFGDRLFLKFNIAMDGDGALSHESHPPDQSVDLITHQCAFGSGKAFGGPKRIHNRRVKSEVKVELAALQSNQEEEIRIKSLLVMSAGRISRCRCHSTGT